MREENARRRSVGVSNGREKVEREREREWVSGERRAARGKERERRKGVCEKGEEKKSSRIAGEICTCDL